MNFVLKSRNFVFKTRDFVFKMMNFAALLIVLLRNHIRPGVAGVAINQVRNAIID